MTDHKRRIEVLQRCAALLAEHFDSVQIICTNSDMDGAAMVHYGDGNWYARYGSVQEWLERERARDRRVTEIQVESEHQEEDW